MVGRRGQDYSFWLASEVLYISEISSISRVSQTSHSSALDQSEQGTTHHASLKSCTFGMSAARAGGNVARIASAAPCRSMKQEI